MKLNTLSPAQGSKPLKQRVGRGIGSGIGKTCGKGHKGQKARAGGYHKINFEGGQMPLQRRLPKMGFNSYIAKITAEVNLHELSKIDADVIDLKVLKDAGIIKKSIREVKIILSGKLENPIKLKGLRVTKGARECIENLGGSIEE